MKKELPKQELGADNLETPKGFDELPTLDQKNANDRKKSLEQQQKDNLELKEKRELLEKEYGASPSQAPTIIRPEVFASKPAKSKKVFAEEPKKESKFKKMLKNLAFLVGVPTAFSLPHVGELTDSKDKSVEVKKEKQKNLIDNRAKENRDVDNKEE
jgi:hypothetical protein